MHLAAANPLTQKRGHYSIAINVYNLWNQKTGQV